MRKRREPFVYTIESHQSFAHCFVQGVLDQFDGDPLGLARALIILPNGRSVQSVRDAFLRHATKGFLLPKLISLGHEELGSDLSGVLDPIDVAPIPQAIAPLYRQLILARLIQEKTRDHAIDLADALRLAETMAQTLDQLQAEDVPPAKLKDLDIAKDLEAHWQAALETLTIVLDDWPKILAQHNAIDPIDRRNRLLVRQAQRWAAAPPDYAIFAAGISTAAPAVAALLRTISRLPQGHVVLAGLDLNMTPAEWDALDGDGEGQAADTAHPQYHLKLLMNRMKVARTDVQPWGAASVYDTDKKRSKTLSLAMQSPEEAQHWHMIPPNQLRLSGVTTLACASPAHEAQVIAIRLRAALDVPGQTAALITPDRNLAQRVIAHLKRWEINIDDSAGVPLSQTRIGSLCLAFAHAAASHFAPVELLGFLKHPLIKAQEDRLAWLDGVRTLDLALRGPRPQAGLEGLETYLAAEERRANALLFFQQIKPILAPTEQGEASLSEIISTLCAILRALCGDEIWAGHEGHAASALLDDLVAIDSAQPIRLDLADFPAVLRQLMAGQSVRPAINLHPRLFIWGLLEARLQSVDIAILGGLNETVWPALPTPDPWLAPRVRRALGLPTLEQRMGLSAHDFVGALCGNRDVLLTRARRDPHTPSIASRFLLRLQALTGGLPAPETPYAAYAHLVDQPASYPHLRKRPAPMVAAEHRPKTLRITAVDVLRADPFAYYANAILKLSALDCVDCEPSAAWRGTLTHDALDHWVKGGVYDAASLHAHFTQRFDAAHLHPILRALWLPRFTQAADFIAAQTRDHIREGRTPLATENAGEVPLAGVTITGRLDRIDTLGAQKYAILDYKTGAPPSVKQVKAGFALQLGLLGYMAQQGGFKGVQGSVDVLEYWSLARNAKTQEFGYSRAPFDKYDPQDFITECVAHTTTAIETWLTGDAPFKAKAHPQYAYDEYDHLMRYDEWAGRDE